MRVTRELKYRVPEALIRYLVNEPDPTEISEISLGLSNFRLVTGTQVSFGSDFEDHDLDDLAKTIIRMDGFEKAQSFVRSVVQTGNHMTSEKVQILIDKIVTDYAQTVFTKENPKVRPIRGPFGEATIELKPGAQPVKQQPIHLVGERREALS